MKPSILIVDDHFSICCNLGKLLYKDYAVHRAFNGKEALEIFRKHSEIKIILTDINMPIMDGFDLIRNVRVDNKEVAIIAMTAVCTEDVVEKLIACGANKYISKPLELDELEATLKESLAAIIVPNAQNITKPIDTHKHS